MKRALITGITGQDGAYLAQLLLHQGYEVVGVSPQHATMNYWRLEALSLVQDEEPVPNLELSTMDITCPASVATTVAEGGFDEIYNLAAQSFVAESFASPIATLRINTQGVYNLLEAIRKHSPTTRLYQASTSEMFGSSSESPQSESTPFHPRSPYAVAKTAAHYAVQNYREAYGLFACCGILFNHESPLRGIEFVTRKVTDGVARIVAGKAERLALGNLSTYRDWGHAEDYVRAMYLMMQQAEPDDFVIATGETHSIKNLVKLAFGYVNLDYEAYVEIDPRYARPSDVLLLCGDSSKARETLDWHPEYTFKDTICQMVDCDLHRHGQDPLILAANRA